jgi:hypothetical protein
MLEARQLGRADVEKESVALPRLTFKSTQRGWPAGTQSSDVTECIEGEEGALHAMTGLIQFQEHEVYDLVRRVGHVTSDRGNRAHQVSDDIG